MWFGVLGRLAARRPDGTDVLVGGTARRLLLAALLYRAGTVVTASTLIDDVWGAAAPRSALGSLRSHMARLRDDLGRDEADTLIRTEGDGYRLVIGREDLDASTFERLAAEAGTCQDAQVAITRYDEALALWRDEAYVEFGDAAFAVAERIRLAELRALARERRTDLVLQIGRAGELIGDLEQRVRAEPYRERAWEQLALALYRGGRQADALHACRRARRVLDHDLGVEPGPALRALEQQLLRQDPALLVTRPEPLRASPGVDRCPYLGLAGYDERDAALFVGRERLTSMLAARLGDQSIVLLTGASGVGKSSLVRAGLLPALRSGALPGSAAWRIEVRSPTDAAPRAAGDGVPDLLVLDQTEELFTTTPAPVRDQLLAQLAGYVEDQGGRLLLVLRSDFYARLADVELLAPYAEKTAVLVGSLRADELRRALIEPAAAAGLRLEPDLVETVLDDTSGEPEPLPLLSAAMVRTWERRDGGLLTLEGYRQAGGLAGALEAAAEECFDGLGEAQRRAARHVLVRLALPTPNGWIRRPLNRATAALTDPEQDALAALINARLLVASADRVELAHEALLLHWPRLRGWLAERTLAADLLHHLNEAATAWGTSGEMAADLYRGPRLSAALDWRAEHPEDLSPAEQKFLDASEHAADAELAAARSQLAREVRGRRNLRRIATGLAAAVLVAVAGGAIAVHERGIARTEAGRAGQAALAADARRLAALSLNAPDIATSSLLAAAAYRLQDSPDSRGALLSAVERNQSALWRIATTHRPQRVVASPDGSRVATLDNRRNVAVFDVATRKQVAGFPADGEDIEGMTSDGRDVVVFGPANDEVNDIGRVSLVDVASGKRARVLTTASDQSGTEPALSSDSHWLVLATTEHRGGGIVMDVFDGSDWSLPPRQFVESGKPMTVAAGRTAFAVERTDGSVDVRAFSSLHPLGGLPGVHGATLQPAGPGALGISPDGSSVARIYPTDPRAVAVYVTKSPSAPVATLPTQNDDVFQLAVSPDGTQLALGTAGGAVSVYRTSDGTQAEALAGHTGPVTGVAWTGGGSTPVHLYTVGLDSQLVSWSVSSLPGAVTESGPSVAAADRGETFGHFVLGLTPVQGNGPATQERGYLIDLDTGRRTFWPLGLDDGDYVNQAVASFDGTRALLSVENSRGVNRIEIWDLTRGVRIGQLALPGVTAKFPVGLNAAITPDGRTAYSSLGASRIGVFDLPSGRYVRSFTVRFAQPDAARIYAVPWMFDPHGRLLFGGFDPNPSHGSAPPSAGPVDALPPNQRLGLLDVSTLRLVAQTGLGDVQSPSAVAWSHDGTLLAVGTLEGTLAVYDATALSLDTSAGVVEPGWVKTASFAPDDQSLVTGGTGGAVNFYNVPDLRRMGAPLIIGTGANNGGVYAWYGPTGQVEGYASDVARPTSDLQRWFTFRADPGALMSTACGLAGSDITRAQWQRYVGDQPYEHVCPAAH